MDVKACDVCKKTNLECDLFQFFEYRLTDQPGKVSAATAPIGGFSLRKPLPRDLSDMEMGVSRGTELVCKECGEKKIAVVMAVL